MWAVGPIKVWRTPKGVKWGLNRSLNLGGGLAACWPTDPAKMSPRRTAVMMVGGPIFSLTLAVICGWGMVGHFDGAAKGGGIATVLYNLYAFMALLTGFIFAVTAAPFTAGGFKSDGKRAWELLRGDGKSEQEGAM